MAKDRARPFSRKHRRYWIPVTGGMVLIGLLDVVLGYCSYTKPSDVHERILYNVQTVGSGSAPTPQPATDCPPAVTQRVAAQLPGAIVTACAPGHASVVRGSHHIELTLGAAGEITEVAETLALPDIPAQVMRAFAVAYPRTIPARATKRTRKNAAPTYELAFPPGREHTQATLAADGSVLELR